MIASGVVSSVSNSTKADPRSVVHTLTLPGISSSAVLIRPGERSQCILFHTRLQSILVDLSEKQLWAAIAPSEYAIAAHKQPPIEDCSGLELVAQIEEPVTAFLRVSGRVEVVAVKDILDPGLHLEGVVWHGQTHVRGCKRLAVRSVER